YMSNFMTLWILLEAQRSVHKQQPRYCKQRPSSSIHHLGITQIAVATVAAFAASEGHAHPRVVELPKTEEGLGFNIMGGKEQNSPIYISRVIPGGVADRQGGLKRGDQLLSVNGVSVEAEQHEKAVELLKAAQGSVKLVVRYTPKVLEEMEARFEKMRSARRRQQHNSYSLKCAHQQCSQSAIGLVGRGNAFGLVHLSIRGLSYRANCTFSWLGVK
ncbi:hypothetical protein GOODEAATRI_007908, partial [Goodea atripinnis]